jgi:hypothetical protein
VFVFTKAQTAPQDFVAPGGADLASNKVSIFSLNMLECFKSPKTRVYQTSFSTSLESIPLKSKQVTSVR